MSLVAQMTTWSTGCCEAGQRTVMVRLWQHGAQLWLMRCAMLPERVASTHWPSLSAKMYVPDSGRDAGGHAQQ
jgi:hypothetical protein